MLKISDSVKKLEEELQNSLRHLIEEIPAIRPGRLERGHTSDDGPDFLMRLNVGGRRRVLVCEAKIHAQPRQVRPVLLQLQAHARRIGDKAVPMLVAPFLSSQVQALCREQGVSYLDLEGNARLAFDGIFIERIVIGRRAVERRILRSLFKPKSACVLRAMLRNPARAWRVAELAEATGVSLGHVNNVKVGLLEREWGANSDSGLFLSQPEMLLNTWRDVYEPPVGECVKFYTTLHGSAFESAVRSVLGVHSQQGRAIFASFSAAQWLAPYGRTGTHCIYADEEGVRRLRAVLKPSVPAKGENVVVTVPKDEAVFRGAVEPAPGLVCTDPVQTYLDLAIAGERGRESAEHLRSELMKWSK